MRYFLRTLPGSILRVFAPRYIPWHVLAIALTALLVYTDLDWKYFIATEHLYPYFFWTAAVGGLLPLLLPLGLLLAGHLKKKTSYVRDAWAFASAAALGWIVSSIYKVFTGRVQPNLQNYAHDISHGFQFGILRHGIFWGWPSSHTAVAFSMALAFFCLYPARRYACAAWIVYAFLIGLGVSMSIHWLSDAVAGALIGSVCGLVAGKTFAEAPLATFAKVARKSPVR